MRPRACVGPPYDMRTRIRIGPLIGLLVIGCGPRITVIEDPGDGTDSAPPGEPDASSGAMETTRGADDPQGTSRAGGSSSSGAAEDSSSSTGLPAGCASPSCNRCAHPEAFACLPDAVCAPGTLPTIDWSRVGTDDCFDGDCVPAAECGVDDTCDCHEGELCLSIRDYGDEACTLLGWQCIPDLGAPGCDPCPSTTMCTTGGGVDEAPERNCICF